MMLHHWPATFPAAKAIQLRAFLFALQSKSPCTLHQITASNDLMHALGTLSDPPTMQNPLIIPSNTPLKPNIWVGNSGVLLRFLSAYAALQPTAHTIDGDDSIRKRPMASLLDALRSLGAQITFLGRSGFAPFRIQGPIKGGRVSLSSKDSQHASALIYALAFAHGSSTITWGPLGEHAYITLTLQWLKFLGIPYHQDAWSSLSLEGSARPKGFSIHIPIDTGLMSFAAALAVLHRRSIRIPCPESLFTQPDSALFDVFNTMGIPVSLQNQYFSVKTVDEWSGIDVDINHCIDCLPILTLIATQANSPTRIRGATVVQTKESPRLTTTAQELTRMGAKIKTHSDGLTVYPSSLRPAQTHSHGDHRLGMMLWVANCWLGHQGIVDGLDCIQKSYPSFIQDALTWEASCPSV